MGAQLEVKDKDNVGTLFDKLARAKEAQLPDASVAALAAKVKEKTEIKLEQMVAGTDMFAVIDALAKAKAVGLTSFALDTIASNARAKALKHVQVLVAAENVAPKAIKTAFEVATLAGVTEYELASFRTELHGKVKAQVQSATSAVSGSSA